MNGTPIDPIILSGIAGLGIAVALAAGLIKWHKAVLKNIKAAFKALFTFSGFFWIVNLSCMAYSAQNAGYIFGLYEASGFIIGLALDGLIIVFTQTALAAKARGETTRAALILLFIVGCCLLSTIGNLAHNLHTNIDAQTSGVWFQEIIPYVTSLMPLLLIAMAWVADLKINPLEKEDPKLYETNQQKQIDFQQIQIESNEKRAGLETRAIAVEVLRRRNSALRRGKVPGSFRWFWEKAVDASEIIAGVSAQLTALFNPHIEEMKRELEALRNEKEDYIAHAEQVNTEKMIQFQQSCRTFISRLIEEIRVDFSTQNEQYHFAFVQQNEQYRLGLGQQYDQDITLIKSQLTSRIDEALSDVKTTISQDVEALNEAFDLVISTKQSSAKSSNVIERTPEVEFVINRYPNVESWLDRPQRSVTLQDIIDATGHTSQLIHRRARAGAFRATRREGYYRLDSVIEWLRTAPLPRPKEEEMETDKAQESSPLTQANVSRDTDEIEAITPQIPVTDDPDNNVIVDKKELSDTDETEVISQENIPTNGSDLDTLFDKDVPEVATLSVGKTGDKLVITVTAMRDNPQITDQELAGILGLKRPGSARLWKVKAQELLNKEQPSEERVLKYATA